MPYFDKALIVGTRKNTTRQFRLTRSHNLCFGPNIRNGTTAYIPVLLFDKTLIVGTR